MAEFVRPGGDDEDFSEEEAEIDLLSPQRHASSLPGSKNEASGNLPLPVLIPYDPVNMTVGGNQTTAVEINKVLRREELSELLTKKNISTKVALLASLKYYSSVDDFLVSKVLEHRVFKIGSLGLLWFHMLLDDPSAVVPEIDVDIVLVRSESDLLSLTPACPLHRYALVLSSSSQRCGPWRIIPLSSGLSTAMNHLKRLIYAQEAAIAEVGKLAPGSDSLAAVLSPSEVEEYGSVTPADWGGYVRNKRVDRDMSALLGKVVASSEVMQMAIARVEAGGEGVKRGEKVVRFGEFTEEPGVKVAFELKTGGGERETELRKLGNVSPFHTTLACLKFPEASSVALPRLGKIMKLLVSLVFGESESWKASYRLTHLKYVKEGSSACVLLAFNLSSIVSFFKNSGSARLSPLLSLLTNFWVLPQGQTVLKVNFEMMERASEWLSGKSPKALKVTQQSEWSELWRSVNRKEKLLEGCWVEGRSEQEIDVDGAKREVGKWLSWLNYAKKVDRAKSFEMARHIFEYLQAVSTRDDLSFEAYGPGFSMVGQAHIASLSSFYESLRLPKKK